MGYIIHDIINHNPMTLYQDNTVVPASDTYLVDVYNFWNRYHQIGNMNH